VGNADIVLASLEGAKLGEILKLLGDDRENDINS
jgi:hypothetical protein